jgi:predicted nucleic acid-binding protein
MDERNRLFTHAVSVAEIISKEKRRSKDPEVAFQAITNLSKIIPVEENDSKAVGYLHAEIKSKNKNFGLADSFVLFAARKIGGSVLTGDPDFQRIKDAILLK